MVARSVLAVVALAAALWLGLSLRSAHLEQQAANVALLAKRVSPAAGNQALRQIRDARAWQPDSAPKLLESQLDLRIGQRARAEALIRQVLASEPKNMQGWFYLYRAAPDARVATTARRRFEALRGG